LLGSIFGHLFEVTAGWSAEAVFLRLLLATIVGTVIGLEREFKNKGAGIKTHVLVCIGAAMSMIVSQYVYMQFPDAAADMNRLGAGVISGVGFLGVGTIIVTGKNEVRGLTTAAGLWACACIGLAAGIGYVEGTILALVFVLFTFFVLSRIDSYLHHISKTFDLYIEFEDRSGVKEFIKKLHLWDCSYSNLQLSKGEAGGRDLAVTLSISLPSINRKDAFIDTVQSLDIVSFCEEI